MKQRHLATWLLLLIPATTLPAIAEDATLVADLGTFTEKHSSGFGPMVLLDEPAAGRYQVLYAADDGRHGNELWVTEVGPAGRSTRLVIDLCPGPCSSDPVQLTVVGDQVFFFADEGLYDRALYTTRGSEATTVRVHVGSTNPTGLGYWREGTLSHAGLFFFVDHPPGATCRALWASDGTPQGTRALEQPCPRSGIPTGLTSTAAGVYFKAGGKLMKASPDPQDPEGFSVVELSCPGNCSLLNLSNLVELDGQVFFHTNQPANLYRSDGTAIHLVRSFGSDISLSHLQLYGGRVLFGVFDLTWQNPEVIYQTDGTPVGTKPCPELASAAGFQIEPRAADDPALLFYQYPPARRIHAFTFTGHRVLLTGVEAPINVREGGESLYGAGSAAGSVSGGLAFGTPNTDLLYQVDPSLALRFVGHFPGIATAKLTVPARGPFQAGTFYRLDDGGGFEPFFDENGPAPAIPVADIARDEIDSSSPRPVAAATGFVAVLGDGRLAAIDDGATSAALLAPGNRYQLLAATAGKVFLRDRRAEATLAVTTGGEPTWLGVDQVRSAERNQPATQGGEIFFTTGEMGQDVHASDGTVAGTRLVADVQPYWFPPCSITCGENDLDHLPLTLLALGDRLFWDGDDGSTPGQVFTSRPGQAGVDLLASSLVAPRMRFHWRGAAYFTTGHPFYEVPALWVSDGSAGGTVRLAELHSEQSQPEIFAGHGNAVFFVVNGPDGQQLWRSDGTPAGTARFDTFGPQAAFGKLVATGGRLFVPAATPALGAELWAIESEALYLVRDLLPGPRSSHPSELYALADGRLVFSADDGVYGAEAWITDGKADGTRLLADLGPGGSGPQFFVEKAGRLVFSAHDGEHGREPWTLAPAPALPPCPADRLCLRDGRFEVGVEFRGPNGAAGTGRRVLASSESGVFSFFSAENWELQVKVLDGCAVNQHFWVFAAATTDVDHTLQVLDRATGQTRRYHNPQGTLAAATADTGAFAGCGAAAPAPRYQTLGAGGPDAALCPGDAGAFCFGDYRVRVEWETPQGQAGPARPVARGSAESGLLTFFSADNWEMMVKLLDGCAINGHRWLFAAGSTNVGWRLTLEHRTDPGFVPKVYRNPVGQLSPAIADTAAAPCPP